MEIGPFWRMFAMTETHLSSGFRISKVIGSSLGIAAGAAEPMVLDRGALVVRFAKESIVTKIKKESERDARPGMFRSVSPWVKTV